MMICTALHTLKAVKHSSHLQVPVNLTVKGNTEYLVEDSLLDFCLLVNYGMLFLCLPTLKNETDVIWICGLIESPLVSLWRAKGSGWHGWCLHGFPRGRSLICLQSWTSPDYLCIFLPVSCFKSCFRWVLCVKESQANNRTTSLSITTSFTEQSNWNIRSKLMITFTVRCQS